MFNSKSLSSVLKSVLVIGITCTVTLGCSEDPVAPKPAAAEKQQDDAAAKAYAAHRAAVKASLSKQP